MAAPITSNRLQRAEHYYNSYAVVIPAGIGLEEALKEEYWAHVAPKLRQHDIIRIIPEEGTYFAEALVLSAGRGFAKLRLLRHEPFEDEDQTDVNDAVEIKWRGPHAKWSILRKSDSQVLREGIVEKGDALREAAGYAKAA